MANPLQTRKRFLFWRSLLIGTALAFYTYAVVAVVECQYRPLYTCETGSVLCGSCVLSRLANDLACFVQLLGGWQQPIVTLITENGLSYISYLVTATVASTQCYAWYRKIRPNKAEVQRDVAEGDALEMVINHKQPFGDANPKYAGVLLKHKGKELLKPGEWLSSPGYRGIGTAWRLSNNVLVTAWHVVDGLDPKESLSIGTMDKDGRAVPLDIPPTARVHMVPAKDIAFISDNSIGRIASRLGLNKLSPVKTFAVAAAAVGYHPELRKIVVSKLGHINMRDGTHTCNTVRGMSGGPLMSGSRFVGLHTGGSYDPGNKTNYFVSGRELISIAKRMGIIGEESPYEDDPFDEEYTLTSVDQGDSGHWGDDVVWEYKRTGRGRGSRYARTMPDDEYDDDVDDRDYVPPEEYISPMDRHVGSKRQVRAQRRFLRGLEAGDEPLEVKLPAQDEEEPPCGGTEKKVIHNLENPSGLYSVVEDDRSIDEIVFDYYVELKDKWPKWLSERSDKDCRSFFKSLSRAELKKFDNDIRSGTELDPKEFAGGAPKTKVDKVQPSDFHPGVSSNKPNSVSPHFDDRTLINGFQQGYQMGALVATGLRNNVHFSIPRRQRQKGKKFHSKTITESGKKPGTPEPEASEAKESKNSLKK